MMVLLTASCMMWYLLPYMTYICTQIIILTIATVIKAQSNNSVSLQMLSTLIIVSHSHQHHYFHSLINVLP